jgi:hypothetical protein
MAVAAYFWHRLSVQAYHNAANVFAILLHVKVDLQDY